MGFGGLLQASACGKITSMDTELISEDIRYYVATGLTLAMAFLPVAAISVMNMMDKVVRGQSRFGLLVGMVRPLIL